MKQGGQPINRRDRRLAEAILQQMTMLSELQRVRKAKRWEVWLQRFFIVAGCVVTSVGLSRLLG